MFIASLGSIVNPSIPAEAGGLVTPFESLPADEGAEAVQEPVRARRP